MNLTSTVNLEINITTRIGILATNVDTAVTTTIFTIFVGCIDSAPTTIKKKMYKMKNIIDEKNVVSTLNGSFTGQNGAK